ncbi:MAG: HAD-IA family hydrolase [Pseudomonadota bacterium]
MELQSLLLGSIGVVAETSDIQRRAYNRALAEAGLDWHWDDLQYRNLLKAPGGRRRLRRLSADAASALSDTEIEAIHTRKTEIACAEVIAQPVELRPGVAQLIEAALLRGVKVAFVTTTYRANIDAIAQAAGDALPIDRFAGIFTVDDAKNPKPAPDIYQTALQRLGVPAGGAVAIEDSAASVASARAAGIYTLAFPGAFTLGQDFSEANEVIGNLEDFTLPTTISG